MLSQLYYWLADPKQQRVIVILSKSLSIVGGEDPIIGHFLKIETKIKRSTC